MTLPYQRHSETSKEAAEAAEPQAKTWREKVYQVIAARPNGATDEEVQITLNLNPSTERPRRVELLDAGRIVDSGKTRNTKSGRAAVVWIKTPSTTAQQQRLF